MVDCFPSLLRKYKFFVQFFSRAHARIHDGNVDLGAKTAHPDHLPRQIINSDSFSHLEHENVGAVRVACRLDNQPGSLGNIHEVTGHVWMRDSDRTALVYLPSERRNNATSAP